jgi:hypothetical protein
MSTHPSWIRTGIENLIRNGCYLCGDAAELSRKSTHVVQNLERSNLRGDSGMIQEMIPQMEEGGAVVLDFRVASAADILEDPLPYNSYV